MLKTQGTTIYGNRYRVISPIPARTFKGEPVVRVRFVLTGNEQVITLKEFETGDFTDNNLPVHLRPTPEAEEVMALTGGIIEGATIETSVGDTSVTISKEGIDIKAKEIKVETKSVEEAAEEKEKTAKKPTAKTKDKK